MYGHKSKGHRMSRRHSTRLFSNVAQHVHPVNIHRVPMRGGFRL